MAEDGSNNSFDEKVQSADEAFDRLKAGARSLGDALRQVGKAVLDVIAMLGDKLAGAFKGTTDQANKLTAAVGGADKGLGGAFAAALKKMMEFKLVGEIVGGIIGGMLFGAVQRLAGALSGVLAPNVEAVSGGLGKMTDSTVRMNVAIRDLATEIERAQQRALAPLKDKLAEIIESVTQSSAGFAEFAAYWGQLGSVVTTVIGVAAKAAATIVTVGAAIAGLGSILKFILPLMGVQFTGVISGLATVIGALASVSIKALVATLGELVALAGGVTVVMTGLGVVLAAVAGAFLYVRSHSDAAGKSLQDRLDQMADGNEKVTRLAESLRNLSDEMKLNADAARAARDADAALAAGDAAGAAAIEKEIAARRQELDNRKEFQRLTQQIIDQYGRTRAEAEKEAQKLMEREAIEKRISAAIQARQQLEQHEREVIEFNLKLAQSRLAVEAEGRRAEAVGSQGRQQQGEQEKALAEMKGDVPAMLEAARKITDEYLQQRDLKIADLQAQRTALEEEKKAEAEKVASIERGYQAEEAKLRELQALQDDAKRKIAYSEMRGESEAAQFQRQHLETLNKAVDSQGELVKRRTEDVHQIELGKARVTELAAQQKTIAAQIEKEKQDRSVIIEQQRKLIDLKREEYRLRDQQEKAADALEDFRNSRFGAPGASSGTAADIRARYEGRFAESRAELDKLAGSSSEADMERKAQLISRLNELIGKAQEAGSRQLGRREQEYVLEQQDKLSKLGLDKNREQQKGLKEQLDELKAKVDQGLANPLKTSQTYVDAMKKGFADLPGLIGSATDALSPYEEKLRRIAALVATIPNGSVDVNGSHIAAPGDVSPTPGGATVLPRDATNSPVPSGGSPSIAPGQTSFSNADL